ncbi:tetratricopeptide repeat protein [Imbroritus primus]|uniref:Tetratricopeptide repeat protein n=1 Tax=Imbroritus primus TaxID=3058603 RepID=A0ACD3SMS8_9BURK|nr:tetratricopeptide repeat protein [Burkholderiaceae bacterium PBA]
MAYDLEEQEKLDSVKAWWQKNGGWITSVLLVVMLALAGWNGWNWWQRKQATDAALLYEQVQKAVEARDAERIRRSAADMQEKYGKTAYGEMTALLAARALYDAGDLATAKSHLKWAAEHAKREEYRVLARVRLAGVLLDEKAYDEGLALLQDKPPAAFAGVVADRRGDLYAAQGKAAEARTAYREALEAAGKDQGTARQLIQFKLDALGDA